MPTFGSNVGGVGGLVLFGVSSLWQPHETPLPDLASVINDGQLFSPEWGDDSMFGGDPTPEMHYWDGSAYVDVTAICSPFALSRVSASVHTRAMARAMLSAQTHPSDCILATEIGISLPSAFVYDEKTGEYTMVTAPKIINGTLPKLVKIKPPDKTIPPLRMRFNSSITTEVLLNGERNPSTMLLDGSMAFCVQLLRASIAPPCWRNLD